MVNRRSIARYAAPLAFLAAVTIAVLLVRAGMDEAGRRREPAPATPSAATRPKAPSAERYYRVRRGDTLAAIAPRFRLTETELLALNPGIEPTALRIGQRIRVR